MKARLYHAICMNDATCNIGTCAIVELLQQRCLNTVGQCIVWYGLKILKGFEIDQSPPQTARYIRQVG